MDPETFRSTARRLMEPGSRVLCAVSGGADSMALLHLLRETGDYTLFCAHFNHCLRGEESDRDERFVRERCAALGIECRVGRADVAALARERGKGTEEAAREARYAFLRLCAGELGCSYIATAHTRDDNAETVLLRLARGSGTRGLGGIPEQRGEIVRPLLRFSRGEIEEYLAMRGIDHVEDSSNADLAYARNRVRGRVLPELREVNAAAAENICAAAEHLRADEEFLTALTEDFLRRSGGEGSLSVRALLSAPESIAHRALRRRCGGTLSAAHHAALMRLCASDNPHGALDLPGLRVVRERDTLLFAPETLPVPEKRELIPGRATAVPELGLTVVCREAYPNEEIHNSFNTFYFKSEKIRARMFVAPRTPGAFVRLAGRGCTKPLKKLFAEARIPLAERERIPVIYDGEGVAAVQGFGVAERLTPSAGDRMTVIEFRETEKEERSYGG